MSKENVENLSDKQLIEMAKSGDKLAEEVLIKRYKPMVIKLSRLYDITDNDIEDIVAEGIIGIFRAVKNFDKSKNASFSTYCYSCINNAILNALKVEGKYQNFLNMCVTIDDDDNELESHDDSIERYINEEEVAILKEKIKSVISDKEYKVFEKYLSGEKNKEIAEELSCATKDVENALYRARNKIANMLKEKS